MLKLFHSVGSCSLASLIALAEAGVEYELVRMSTARGDQRKPEYLAVNPKGRVPALATDQGIITENPAILAYVARNQGSIEKLNALRDKLWSATNRPVTLGFGPRYLHSTGQLHKGGPKQGVFALIIDEPLLKWLD